MPVLASTIGTTTPSTPLVRANLKNVILLSIFAFTVAALATYAVIKAVKLYREHLETERLARKVWDAEARRIKEEEEIMQQQQLLLLLEAAGKWQQHFPDKSIVPSPPPVAYVTPYADDDRRHQRSGREPEQMFDGRPVALISPMCIPGTSWCARYADRPRRPFKEMLIAPLGIPLALAAGDRSHMQLDRSLRGHSSTLDNKPHQTATALAADQHCKVVVTAGRRVVERRVLSPLSAAEVKRRRRLCLCLPTREARRNGPRTVGKENYNLSH